MQLLTEMERGSNYKIEIFRESITTYENDDVHRTANHRVERTMEQIGDDLLPQTLPENPTYNDLASLLSVLAQALHDEDKINPPNEEEE